MANVYAGWMTPSAQMATKPKPLFPALVAGFLFGANPAEGHDGAPLATSMVPSVSLDSLAWLSGAWHTQTPQGPLEEHWLSPAPGRLIGIGRLIPQTPDPSAFFELLRIEPTAQGLALLASPMGAPPVAFHLVESGPMRVVFSNPTHNFPQRIAYWREGEHLCVGLGLLEGPWRESWCYQPILPSAGKADSLPLQ
jgi:hypothetical protein